MMIQLADARRMIAAAEKKADEIGQPMNVAIVDEGGNLIAFERMANAWLGSIDIAQKKAVDFTCVRYYDEGSWRELAVGGSVFWNSCFQQWQSDDFRWRRANQERMGRLSERLA